MTYNRQTPAQILAAAQVELDDALEGADARLRRSVENVLSKVMVMASYDAYGFIEWVFRQIHPLTADDDILEQNHATLRGITLKDAAAASGAVTFTGTSGTVIPAGTILARTDGVEYTLDEATIITEGAAVATVTASNAGADGNAASGAKLNISSPIAGVQSAATVAANGLIGGADIEDTEALRKRVVQAWQAPAQGGADHDYERWALEVPGVTRAWVYRAQQGIGTVTVIIVMDDKPDTIIPTEAEAALVKDYIDPLRPATAKGLYVIPPTPVPVDFTIQLSPNSAAVQAAVMAEIKDFFSREAEPGGTLYVSRIREAISAATGEFDHVLISPAANILRSFGEISTLGNMTFEAVADE